MIKLYLRDEREGNNDILQDKIKSNEFLLGLNMENADNEQKLAWLCQIIANEIDKPEDQQDIDLIAECTEYMRMIL